MDHDHSNHVGHIGQNSVVGGSAHLDHLPVVSGEQQHGSMHSMAFHFGSIETILFNFWKTGDAGGIILSCVVIIAMCFLMELVRFLRTYRSAQQPATMGDRLRFEPTVSSFVVFDALLHFIQLAFSYSLMLIFMSFNGGWNDIEPWQGERRSLMGYAWYQKARAVLRFAIKGFSMDK
ncbi:hypothetical protein RB195_016985 [Necator americanus]|uniref:Copper transport protein n=1 Tax=Necator americanus TaxID=51031 RepID=A0ABR1C596_NECAM